MSSRTRTFIQMQLRYEWFFVSLDTSNKLKNEYFGKMTMTHKLLDSLCQRRLFTNVSKSSNQG